MMRAPSGIQSALLVKPQSSPNISWDIAREIDPTHLGREKIGAVGIVSGEVKYLASVRRPAQRAIQMSVICELLRGASINRLNENVLYGVIEVSDTVKAVNGSGDAVGRHRVPGFAINTRGIGDQFCRPVTTAVDCPHPV